MKKIALLTGTMCAISLGAFAQTTARTTTSGTVVMIPAFENRFASIHQPVVALNTVNRSAAFERRTFGSSGFSTDPAARGVVSSPTANAPRRGALDASTMNIPVFPGNTVFMNQGGFGPGQLPFGMFPPNAGFGGNTGVFIQQGGGSSLTEVDPFRTTATPGPAVNAVPNPAAPVPTIPQLQVNPNPTIPVHQQNPQGFQQVVPGTVIQGTTTTTQPQQTQPQAQGAVPNSPANAVPNSPAPTPSGQARP